MIKLIVLFLVLAALMFVAPMMAENQGFVHIDTGHYVIQMNIVSAILCIVVFYFLLQLVIAVIAKMLGFKSGLLSWYSNSKTAKARASLEKAVACFIEGKYDEAVKQADKNAKWSDIPSFNLLLKFYAACRKENKEEANAVFNDLQMKFGKYNAAVSILRTKMYIRFGEYSKALNIISSLRQSQKSTKVISSLYYECLKKLDKHSEIVDNRKEFIDYELLDEESYEHYITGKVVKQIDAASDRFVLDHIYKDLPKDITDSVGVANSFALASSHFGDDVKAEKIITRCIKGLVDPSMVFANIAKWDCANPRLIEYLENRVKKNDVQNINNTDLLAALANMYMNMNENEKAVSIYESLVNRAPCADYYSRLGQCYQRLGGFQKAALYYKQAQSEK